MYSKYTSTLCRICLEDGATLPIFNDNKNEENIYTKMFLCTQEKLEDITGFPSNICTKCNETLNIICKFIDKYKESCKILENGLSIVKKESNDIFSDNEDYNIDTDADLEKKFINTETKCHIADNAQFNKLIKPLQIKIEKNKIKDKCMKTKQHTMNNINPITKTNKQRIKNVNAITNMDKIASSLLEGDSTWNGEKWCLNKVHKTSLSDSNKKQAIIQKEKRKTVAKEKKIKQELIEIPTYNNIFCIEKKLCDICGEVFKSSDKLLNHKKKTHFRSPVKCPQCPKTLASAYCLSLHNKRKHEKKRDFVCATCGGGFVFKKDMREHIKRVHEKIKKPLKIFSCKFCEKTYKCAKSVIVHERSVHTGHRPAQCTICGSCFYHEDYLREHMRLHTGETPFKCPVCGRGYAQRGNMKSHLRIHRISEIDPSILSKMRPNYVKLLKVS